MSASSRNVTSQEELLGFTYLVSPPEGGQGADLRDNRGILLLHGTGGDEFDLIDMGGFIAPESVLVSARGRAPERGMNRWFARHGPGVLNADDIRRRAEELVRFIPAVCDRHGIHRDRLWAVGYSNGANMAAALLLLHPKVLAGAALFRPMLPLEPDTTPSLRGTPVMIAAGTKDTMIPGDSTRALIDLLELAGADLTVNWAPRGHQFTLDELEMARHWFREHREETP